MVEIDLLEQGGVGADGMVEALAGAGNPSQVLWINVAYDVIDDLGREIRQEQHGGTRRDRTTQGLPGLCVFCHARIEA